MSCKNILKHPPHSPRSLFLQLGRVWFSWKCGVLLMRNVFLRSWTGAVISLNFRTLASQLCFRLFQFSLRRYRQASMQCSLRHQEKKSTVIRSRACSNSHDEWTSSVSLLLVQVSIPNSFKLVYEWSKLQRAATALTLENFSHRIPQNARTAFCYLARYYNTTALCVSLISLTWFSVFREDSEVLLHWVYCYC